MKRNFIKKTVVSLVCATLLLSSSMYAFAMKYTAKTTKISSLSHVDNASEEKAKQNKSEMSEEEILKIKQQIWDKAETGNSIRKTSFKMFKKLAEKNIKSGKNTMISPMSIIVALGMLENGAKGESLNQIEKALGVKVGELNEWYALWSKLKLSSGSETLKLANSVWYKDATSGLRVNNEFLKVLGDIYLAEIISAKFDPETVKEVNSWVNKNTDGMIEKIIDKLNKDSRMLLINATTFKGVWQDEYDDSDVKDNVKFKREDGKIDRVTMLSSVEDEFFENKYLTGTKKHYKDGYYIMLMRPKKGYTVSKVLDKMTPKAFDKLMNNTTQAQVYLKLPCFKFDYKIANCKTALMKMGITDIFDELKADLSGLATEEDGSNLYVDKVIHKTHIELDREGTKAAVVTAIEIVKDTSMPITTETKEVTLDKPFIYAICDEETGAPVFLGTVTNIN